MISIEQVQLLETRVSKAIEYFKKVTAENAVLASERAGLQEKLEANQKRIDELEILVMRFKEDQGRIEDGIVAALDRLSQFEEAFENSLKENVTSKKQSAKSKEKAAGSASSKEIYFEINKEDTTEKNKPDSDTSDEASDDADDEASDDDTSDEAPEEELSSEGELDIF